jgi:outer membrane protein assembly factor BamB
MKNILYLIAFICSVTIASAQDYGWRGPGRSGVYNEKGLMREWPADGPRLIWEAEGIGAGYSSATVTNDAVYVTGKKGSKDVLTAFTQDGKKKWEVIYGDAPSNVTAPETRGTATVSGNRIFVSSGKGEMACISPEGKVLWTVDYFKKYNGPTPTFGISESPLVVDNKVIGTPGGKITSMVAFDVENGDVVWEAPSMNQGTNYVNPLLIQYGGKKVIVTITEGFIIGVNSADGKLLWKFDYEGQNKDREDGRAHINTPLYRDGYLFAANGYKQVAVKIKINDGKDPELVWKTPDIGPHVGGMVLIGNYIYGSTHDTNSRGRWVCIDWTTGKTMWQTLWNNKGAIIANDGLLYVIEEKKGTVGLLRANPEKFDLISSFRIIKGEGPYWAHPVIDKGRLFVRHGNYLGVYSLKSNEAK